MQENNIPDFFEEQDILGQLKPKIKDSMKTQVSHAPSNEEIVFVDTYAGLNVRILAYVFDLIILFIPIFVIDHFFGVIMLSENSNYLNLFIATIYYGLTESSSKRATFGKRIFGITVNDSNGNKLTFLRASLRYLAQIVSIIPLGFGIWIIAFDEKKQAWHDKIVGSYVIIKRPKYFGATNLERANVVEVNYENYSFPTLVKRIQALFIDTCIILLLFFVAAYILNQFSNTPDWLKGGIFITLFFLYEPISVSFFGGTPGHFIMGLRVKDVANPEKNIWIFFAFIRLIIKGLLGWLSFLTVTSDKRRRALHDIASGSIVLTKKVE